MASQHSQPARRGRPRTFDHEQLLEKSVDVFWKHGIAGATTRVLEDELGVSQSSIYNAYGSKDELLDQSVALYETRLNTAVLSRLDVPSREALLEFMDAVSHWVCQDEHRGCLVMNMASESPDHAYRLEAYRVGLSRSITSCLRTFTADEAEVEAKADLLVSAVLGMNVSARCGADAVEITRISDGIKREIAGW